jgi:hypothetical protein
MKKKPSDLLSLLNERRAWELPNYAYPTISESTIAEASRIYAQANDSDPFADMRIRNELVRGFTLASDVIHDANAALARRAAEPKSQFKPLALLKKGMDEYRAWNQHRASQWRKK